MAAKRLKSFPPCRKFLRICVRRKDESGIILLVVLWTLVILTSLAMSLGRNTNIELALTKYALAKAKTKYLAWAGVRFAMEQIRLDSEDENSNKTDTMYFCGIPESEANVEDLFQSRELGEGTFSIAYSSDDKEDKGIYYGFKDEERLINLNGIGSKDVNVLSFLIMRLDFNEETAKIIANSVADWTDADSVLVNDPYGAEDEYYMSRSTPYHCKNLPFDSVEELLLVRGVTQEIYDKLKPYVTVYPKSGELKVNLGTAPPVVLDALFGGLAANSPTIDSSDVESLMSKLMEYRAGEDGQEFSKDDRAVDQDFMSLLLAPERILFLLSNPYQTKSSNYLRMHVIAKESNRSITTDIEAVVDRNNFSVVYWQRN